jgi:hypothetical protein
MALMRERPFSGANFLVDLGTVDARSPGAGFCEVIFPVFELTPQPAVEPTPNRGAGSEVMTQGQHLILKRGLVGRLDLYTWWDKARRGKAPKRRSVTVHLLGEDHETVVMSWRFANARPVSLHYTPLRAAESAIVIETLELAFDSVTMS